MLALALALAIPIGLMALTLADTLPHLSGLTHDLTQLTLPNAPAWLANIPVVGESLQSCGAACRPTCPASSKKSARR